MVSKIWLPNSINVAYHKLDSLTFKSQICSMLITSAVSLISVHTFLTNIEKITLIARSGNLGMCFISQCIFYNFFAEFELSKEKNYFIVCPIISSILKNKYVQTSQLVVQDTS